MNLTDPNQALRKRIALSPALILVVQVVVLIIGVGVTAVSYTHLTLPTIYSV